MIWDLILRIPVTKKMSPSYWIKLSMPPCPLSHLIIEILSFIFHLSWCTIIKQAFCNWNVAKSIKIYPDYKVMPWKYQVGLEILRWCWEVKKVVRYYKMIRWEHCSRYMFSKLQKTITLVRKRWFFSKILRMQDGQEYLSITIVCDTKNQVIFYTIFYSLLHSNISRWQFQNDPGSHVWPKVHY